MLITSGPSIALGVGHFGRAQAVLTGISAVEGSYLAVSFSAAVLGQGLRFAKSRSSLLASGLRLVVVTSSVRVRITAAQIKAPNSLTSGCIEIALRGEHLHLACHKETHSDGNDVAQDPSQRASKSKAEVRMVVIWPTVNGPEKHLAVLFLRAVSGATIRAVGRVRVSTIVIGIASKATGSWLDGGRGQTVGEGKDCRVAY